MDINGLESLVYGVEDMATCIRFNQDFGLELVESGGKGAVFQTVEGSTVVLRDVRDRDLPAAVTPGSQLRRVIWGVSAAGALEAIGAELSKDRDVGRDADGTLWSTDPMGYAIGFRVSRVKPLAETPLQTNVPGRPARVNTRFAFSQRPRVLHLGHVVFHTPNLEATYAFYRDRLDFKLSDTFVNGVGYFIRAKLTHDHHSIFLLHLGDLAGLNHASYQVRNFDDIAVAGEHMEKKGWKSLTGPGRHHIGSNYFWYFHSPCGGAVEYHADIDYLTDDWVPREWEFRPDVAAAWDRGPGFAASA
jgi:catechol 2,3-dioxygenase-like lactoylglutathione lyase family enzyme